MATRKYPDFFQVYRPHQYSERMPVPPAYNKYLPGSLPRKAVLRGYGGNFWSVGLTRTQQCVYFKSGWQRFTEDHDLKDGDTLMFTYDGSRTFGVTIYRGWGYKVTRAPVEVQEISDNGIHEDNGNDIHEDGYDNSYNYSMGSENGPILEDGDENNYSDFPGSEDMAVEEEVDLKVPDENKRVTSSGCKNYGYSGGCSFDPEKYLENPLNPFFVTLPKNRNDVLKMSRRMVKDYDLKFARTVTFIDPIGRLEGRRTVRKDGQIGIKEWCRICRRNKLKPNDKVICEPLRTQGLVHSIKVHIIRQEES